MNEVHCVQGPKSKLRYPNLRAAKVNARMFAQRLLARKEITEDMYAYPCDRCQGWHLTRLAEWNGTPLTQVFIAAPPDMQRWAMSNRR